MDLIRITLDIGNNREVGGLDLIYTVYWLSYAVTESSRLDLIDNI